MFLPCLSTSIATAVDAVIHTAFDHAGPSYLGAVDKDIAATLAMTAALEGTNKVFMSSSGTGVTGDTGLAPVNEQFPVDLKFPMNTRSPGERVNWFFLLVVCMEILKTYT